MQNAVNADSGVNSTVRGIAEVKLTHRSGGGTGVAARGGLPFSALSRMRAGFADSGWPYISS
jgi:hypothetical protein